MDHSNIVEHLQGHYISKYVIFVICTPRQLSQYSDLLQAGRYRDPVLAGRDFLQASTPALGPTQLPVQLVSVVFSRGKLAGAQH
jgi:hypothetical protein